MESVKEKIYSKILKIPTKILFSNDLVEDSLDEPEILDGNFIDALTLEEMQKLILLYRKEKKDFLIAKTSTTVSKDKNELNTFYYSALDFNKELFKIDTENQRLHRMKVKNPLNNVEISTNVEYFKISENSYNKAIVDYFYSDNLKNEIKKYKFNFSSNEQNNDIKENNEIKGNNLIERKNEQNNEIKENSKEELNMFYSESIKKVEAELLKKQNVIKSRNKMIYKARYCGNDDDFFFDDKLRKYFEKNLLKNDIFLYKYLPNENEFVFFEDDFREMENEFVFWQRISLASSIIGFIICLGLFFICKDIIKNLLPSLLPAAIFFLTTIFYTIYLDTIENQYYTLDNYYEDI